MMSSGELCRTDDVMGKKLQDFSMRTELESDAPPKIFWLLAGYFRANPEKFETMFLFRKTASPILMQYLEVNLAKGNFSYIVDQDPHVVANHWKQVLREMKVPLIPFEDYREFGKITRV